MTEQGLASTNNLQLLSARSGVVHPHSGADDSKSLHAVATFSRRYASCSSVSTPSATTLRPMPWAIGMAALTAPEYLQIVTDIGYEAAVDFQDAERVLAQVIGEE